MLRATHQLHLVVSPPRSCCRRKQPVGCVFVLVGSMQVVKSNCGLFMHLVHDERICKYLSTGSEGPHGSRRFLQVRGLNFGNDDASIFWCISRHAVSGTEHHL